MKFELHLCKESNSKEKNILRTENKKKEIGGGLSEHRSVED